MRTFIKIILFSISALFFTGCATLKKDLLDVAHVGVGLGGGNNEYLVARADLQVGALSHPAISIPGGSVEEMYGWRDGNTVGSWEVLSIGEPLSTLVFAFLDKESLFGPVNGSYLDASGNDLAALSTLQNDSAAPFDVKAYGTWLPIPNRHIETEHNARPLFHPNNLTDLNATVRLSKLAVTAGVNPLEVIELVLTPLGLGWD